MGLKIRGGISGASEKPAPLPARTEAWTCSHGHANKPNHTRCLTLGCNEPRDRR